MSLSKKLLRSTMLSDSTVVRSLLRRQITVPRLVSNASGSPRMPGATCSFSCRSIEIRRRWSERAPFAQSAPQFTESARAIPVWRMYWRV